MPRPATGRISYGVRLLPATVEDHRQPGQTTQDVLAGLIADGVNARRGILPQTTTRKADHAS